jgi:hypothetical protein
MWVTIACKSRGYYVARHAPLAARRHDAHSQCFKGHALLVKPERVEVGSHALTVGFQIVQLPGRQIVMRDPAFNIRNRGPKVSLGALQVRYFSLDYFHRE